MNLASILTRAAEREAEELRDHLKHCEPPADDA
jgi:hypothetical protein